MEKIVLGASGIETSRIGLGTWAIGGWMWGGTDEAESIATIRRAVESGITLIDTAPVYGFGRSEEIVGQALAEGGLRGQAQIATKAGLDWADGKVFRDARPARIRREVEDSLRRLRTDVIDLYQLHWPDLETPVEETAETFDDLRREGKIRAVGVSNFSPQQMDAFRAVTRLDTVQPPYNLFEREIERDVLPYAADTGLAVLSYGALCRGLLSGKVTAERVFEGDDLRRYDPKFKPERRPRYLAAVAGLQQFAQARYGRPVLELALRWVLDHGPTIALWGARRPAQLDPVSGIEGWRIDAAAQTEIDAILKAFVAEPLAPVFMAPPAKRPDGV
jgi:aryl-alcohol dehydrogenase-like predicted oxidoreductase